MVLSSSTSQTDQRVVETDTLIIGGGVTGAGIMRDLSLRGIHSILIDKKDLCAGASGGNHGLLHSGGRYVSNDMHSAIECRLENTLLKKLAPQCIEETGGLFVAVEGDDPEFADKFQGHCDEAGIECTEIPVDEARAMEPLLSEKTFKVYKVPDATIDPFKLALDNVAHAENLNDSKYFAHTELVSFTIEDDGTISSATCRNNLDKSTFQIKAKQYINAGGAWAMDIAKKAGCKDVELLYSKGTLLISHDRLTSHVINRLRPPSDGDILVPGGTVSILGTTSVQIEDLENTRPTVAEIDRNVVQGEAMIPELAHARYIRAFARVRPLLQSTDSDDARDATRGFALLNHESQGLKNFATITGGKLTTYRLMAVKAADLIAKRLGNDQQSTTDTVPLPDASSCKWTEPGLSPRIWYKSNDPDDMILCECEMVPQSAIDQIIESAPGHDEKMNIEAIALRSRVGKGPCQGSFCGIRVGSYLYDKGFYKDKDGLVDMRDFFNERFKGLRTIIWGQQAAQMELAEAMHCGLLGLDKLEE